MSEKRERSGAIRLAGVEKQMHNSDVRKRSGQSWQLRPIQFSTHKTHQRVHLRKVSVKYIAGRHNITRVEARCEREA